MEAFLFVRGVLAAACLVMLANASQARVQNGASLGDGVAADFGPAVTFGAKAAVPVGYYQLCKTDNPVCRKSRGNDATTGEGVVRLNDRIARELASVNAEVNRSIRGVSDLAQFGVADRWSVSPKKGDCEDFALTKKARLLKLGWPSSALLLALVDTAAGEEHVVLVARTDSGDFILDNLRKDIRPWSAGLYHWKAIQAPGDMWTWYQFGKGKIRMASAAPADQVAATDQVGGPDEHSPAGSGPAMRAVALVDTGSVGADGPGAATTVARPNPAFQRVAALEPSMELSLALLQISLPAGFGKFAGSFGPLPPAPSGSNASCLSSRWWLSVALADFWPPASGSPLP